jgi:hypothetical protein
MYISVIIGLAGRLIERQEKGDVIGSRLLKFVMKSIIKMCVYG